MGVALVRLLLSMNVPKDHGPILVRHSHARCPSGYLRNLESGKPMATIYV